MRTVVVGAGIAGIACARAAGGNVVVLDRGRRVGGRMAVRTVDGRPVDIGASYLTAGAGSPFQAVVQDWCARGLAREWTDTFAVAGAEGITGVSSGPVRYAAPLGLRSLVADLAAGLDVRSENEVTAVTGSTVDGSPADAVLLAMPGPQALRLLDRSCAAAGAVTGWAWEPVLAVALRWPQRCWPADLHGVFINDHPVLGFVADDGDRRGDGAPVLVAHSTSAFAAGHLDGSGTEALSAAVSQVLGIAAPESVLTVARWTFARPAHVFEAPFLFAEGIGLCGDGWGGQSKVEGAWLSGNALGSAVGGHGSPQPAARASR